MGKIEFNQILKEKVRNTDPPVYTEKSLKSLRFQAFLF
jgi:hypothetical protein